MSERIRIQLPARRATARGLVTAATIGVAAVGLLFTVGCGGTKPGDAPSADAGTPMVAADASSVVTVTDAATSTALAAHNGLTATNAVSATGATTTHTEADLITGIRQLVFEGRRSGEGYYDADGKRMIFQSEREPGNPFYQIYILDLETGESRRVSPGWGKTTCGWLAPDGKQAIFASTHEDPDARKDMQAEIDFRASGETRRYSWDYDEDYEIYAVTIGGNDYRNLSRTRGYDAEGALSPDGSQIVFASNRLAYSAPMDTADQQLFDQDPAYMMDIYTMDADGGNVRRLTDVKGYDGGPFFSPDGARIVWRRFNAEGTLAEIWTMNADGTDARQLTAFGALSWAPYFHPSGDYIVFTSSKLGYDNFELFMVDAAGEHEPVRVTFTPDADVLPVFSPDGATLSWSNKRGTAGGEYQIFVADWNDAKARALLELSPPRAASSSAGAAGADDAPAAPPDMAATTDGITATDAKLHVVRLAAAEMDGRQTGTAGERKATQYVADVFDGLGLAPAGDDGYFQAFDFTSGVRIDGVNMLVRQAEGGAEEEGVVDTDWRPLSFSKTGSVGFGGVVFAGYGIVAPKDGEQAAYDSYGDLDVNGKWVVALRYLPEDVDAERRQHLNRYASLRYKAMEARDRGAVGLLVVSGPTSNVKEQLVPLRFDASVAGTSIAAASVTDAWAEGLFGKSGHTLAAAQAALDGGEAVAGFALPGHQIGAHFTLTFDTGKGRNVVGRLQVGQAPSAEQIIIGAHVDHLGHGGAGDSLAKPEEKDKIHYGADDNASGVAGLIEIAQFLADEHADGRLADARRDIVFAAWSGEELGILGSSHYVKAYGDDPKAESIYPAAAAYLNMDMIGRLHDGVILQGIGSSTGWRRLIEQRNVAIGLPLTLSDDTFLPTDATSFYLKGVPILAAFTGAHSEYHTPRDTPERLDYVALAKIARLMSGITVSLARADAPLDYVAAKAPEQRPSSGGRRVYLGTIPDYADTGVAGVLLSGVAEGGPAEQGGLKAGDVIVELAGQKVENIYDYTKSLDALKIGQAIKVIVDRDGQRITLTVTPGSRE
jgi:Tol biopolymer transport system component